MSVTLTKGVLPAQLAQSHGGHVLQPQTWSEYDSLTGGDAVPMPGSGYGWSAVRPYFSAYAPDLFIVNPTSWGEYSHGETSAERSNYRSLMRDWPETFCEIGSDNVSGFALALPAHVAIPEQLAQILASLGESVIYDMEDYDQLEEEVWEDGWDGFRIWDTRQEVSERVGEELTEQADEILTDEWIRTSYVRVMEELGDVERIWESSDCVTVPRADADRIYAALTLMVLGTLVMTCGTCGHRYPDNTPAGRCPREAEHQDQD